MCREWGLAYCRFLVSINSMTIHAGGPGHSASRKLVPFSCHTSNACINVCSRDWSFQALRISSDLSSSCGRTAKTAACQTANMPASQDVVLNSRHWNTPLNKFSFAQVFSTHVQHLLDHLQKVALLDFVKSRKPCFFVIKLRMYSTRAFGTGAATHLKQIVPGPGHTLYFQAYDVRRHIEHFSLYGYVRGL